MFTIDMLPASYGDCLWIEYGDPQIPHRILIDGGKAGTSSSIIKRSKALKGPCEFELLVVTHIDSDHIDGIVALLNNLPPEIKIKQVWFNGWEQITERLGAPAGEYLTNGIRNLKVPWNEPFNGKAVAVPDTGALPQVVLPGGMTLTVLSPTFAALATLVPVWKEECQKAGLLPGSAPAKPKIEQKRRLGEAIDVQALAMAPFEEDNSPSNGSSIAFLAEYDNKSCLLAADAHPSVLVESIQNRMELSRLSVDAFKLAHHGSQNNNSPDLAGLVRAKKYLVSTNGAIYKHPDAEAIARILKMKNTDAELVFNYYNLKKTAIWKDSALQSRWRYEVQFPETAAGGVCVEL